MQRLPIVTAAIAAAALSACGGGDGDGNLTMLPQLPAASGAAMTASCASLAQFAFPNTTISSAAVVAAGTVKVGGNPTPEHCLVKGSMFQRTSAVDGQPYAIGFEMRLPTAWSGRYFYQGNGSNFADFRKHWLFAYGTPLNPQKPRLNNVLMAPGTIYKPEGQGLSGATCNNDFARAASRRSPTPCETADVMRSTPTPDCTRVSATVGRSRLRRVGRPTTTRSAR